MTLTATIIGLLVLAAAFRSLALALAPHGVGVDHWFWKSYVEAYRRTRRFPPSLPQYILDEQQWYPPLFPLLLSALPERIFDSKSHIVAIAIDLGRMLLLLMVAHWLSNGNPRVIMVAGLVYATIPIQTSYNIQLNPRGLAAIMLDALLIFLLVAMTRGGLGTWAMIVFLGGLILLTHKMTTQLLVFITISTAAIYLRPGLLLLLPAWFAAAMVMSRGFYWNVLKAHIEIVSFWHRNWRWIGADLLRESPIYGDALYQRREKLHKPGVRGVAWHAFIMFGFNPAAWIACLLVYERLFLRSAIYPTPLLVWVLAPCAWAVLTSLVNPLKRFGAGYLYVYNTSLMASIVLSLTYQYTLAPMFSTTLVASALILNTIGVTIYYREFLRNPRTRVDDGLEWMIEQLKSRPRGVVMCVPVNWCEVVAYKTGQPVLWGGHGHGFDKLQPTWPRLLVPIKHAVKQYGIRYLLTMEGMLPANFVSDLPPARVVAHKDYRLYCFDATGAYNEEVRPATEPV
ncbi:MAG: hypothetical protein WD845_06300 [Pirellulales bacterium]